MEVCVIGVGYVGLVTAACFAYTGNTVTGVDDDGEKIKLLQQGKIPIYEPFLDQLVTQGIEQGRIRFTEDL